jgi:hypothetical protein
VLEGPRVTRQRLSLTRALGRRGFALPDHPLRTPNAPLLPRIFGIRLPRSMSRNGRDDGGAPATTVPECADAVVEFRSAHRAGDIAAAKARELASNAVGEGVASTSRARGALGVSARPEEEQEPCREPRRLAEVRRWPRRPSRAPSRRPRRVFFAHRRPSSGSAPPRFFNGRPRRGGIPPWHIGCTEPGMGLSAPSFRGTGHGA